MQTYTNDELLSNIKLRALLPSSQSLYSDERLLLLANDELQTIIFPMMMSIKGDYFIHIDEQDLTTNLVYPIPGDAVGIKVKGVYWRDTSWPANQPDQFIPQVNIQDLTNQAAGLFTYLGCYIENNDIHLTNSRNVNGRLLRIRYYKRAAKLVANSQGAQVVDASTSNIEVSNVPSTWTVGTILQCVSSEPPFETKGDELEITSIAGNIITLLNNGTAFTLSDDDWLTLVGETVIAQITPEAHPILAQAVACKCLEGMADPNLITSQSKFQQLYDAFIQAMTPRMDGTAKKIIQRNGTLFWNRVGRGYWIGGR